MIKNYTLVLKKKIALAFTVIFLFLLSAQAQKDVKDIKYQRSSLHTILMESDNFLNKEDVVNSYYAAPFPDKYNNHNLSERSFNPSDFNVSKEEIKAYGIKKTKKEKKKARNYMPIIVDKYLKKNQIAKKMVAKWFNRDKDGAFNMDLISERGFYNASDMQASLANKTARGTSSLGDSGESLINNTFVVVSSLKFISNEDAALALYKVAEDAANQISNEIFKMAALTTAKVLYNKTRKGYSVITKSRLYQLHWNDSVSAVFYNQHWMDKSNITAERKAAFDDSDMYRLNFIGEQKAKTLILFTKESEKTKEAIIKRATIRNIDKVYSKLQKEYDVFKTKTPIYSIDPITAKIGKKEGLEGGEKFEVLEQIVDAETGKIKFDRIAIIRVDKNKIWDNRYVITDKAKVEGDREAKELSEEEAIVAAAKTREKEVADFEKEMEAAEALEDKKERKNAIKALKNKEKEMKKRHKAGEKNAKKSKNKEDRVEITHFKGKSKNLYPGLLLRQIK